MMSLKSGLIGIVTLLGLLLLVPERASAQSGERGGLAWEKGYDLEQGESVTYRVVSLDSIVIWREKPQLLLRQRVERITYRCDTVLPDGYGMSMTLNDVVIRERMDTMPWVTRDYHPWTGTAIYFVMDRQGERLRLRDTLDAPGVLPGAPFQPLLIPHLGPGADNPQKKNPMFDREMWLLENAYPPVQWKGSILRKVLGDADTLGRSTSAVQLNEVGQLWFFPKGPNGKEEISMHARLNGTGNYWIDFKEGYPVAGDYTMIANLTFADADGKNQRFGRQVISMVYEIDQTGEDLTEFLDREGLK